jgi:hypothetical protein
MSSGRPKAAGDAEIAAKPVSCHGGANGVVCAAIGEGWRRANLLWDAFWRARLWSVVVAIEPKSLFSCDFWQR